MVDPFTEALTLHRAGRLHEAASIYRAVLAQDPHHSDSLNLLGVIAHQHGQRDQAIELIHRAIQINPNRPSYRVNLATALNAAGRHEEAIECCRAAVALQPDLVEARLLWGRALQASSRILEATQQYEWLARNFPRDSRGPQELGNLYRELHQVSEADTWYREALKRNPDDAGAHLGLGTLLLTSRQPLLAEPHLERATDLAPRIAAAWTNRGSCLIALGREREAADVLQRALQLDPNNLELGVNLGLAWSGAGEPRKAENCFRSVLGFDAEHPGALAGLAGVRLEEERIDEAIELFEHALRLKPTSDNYKGLADSLWESGDVDRAVATLRAGMARDADDAEYHVRIAVMLAAGGDLAGAEHSCRQALQARPHYIPALIQLGQILRGKLPDSDQALLEQALQQGAPPPLDAGLHFALAHVADGKRDYEQAAEHLLEANARSRDYHGARGRGYDPESFRVEVDRLVDSFTPDLFARLRGLGSQSDRPVFVVGMPRSGTTLVEQILASHPLVFGAGERRFAMQSFSRLSGPDRAVDPLLAVASLEEGTIRECATWHLNQLNRLDNGQAQRIVDKMPENYLLLGWLSVVFPKARFVHCRRDVRDVALSCWMTPFSRVRWADDLIHIATRVVEYRRMMTYWQRALPVAVYEVEYERLVADPEGESRRLIANLGLEWSEKCLSFYQTERLVKTASVVQVRQPVYTRSAGRWKNYRDVMKPFLDEIGRNGLET